MKKQFFTFILCSSVMYAAYMPYSSAQDTCSHKGKFALQFQVDKDFTLNSFQGSIFSGKYNISERGALRLGVSINNSSGSSNILNQFYPIGQKTSSIDKSNSDNYSVILQYLRNNYFRSNLNFYYGLGPNIGYSFLQHSQINGAGVNRTAVTRWSYGANAVAGMEWYFIDDMSLSGEYGIIFTYYEENDSQTSVTSSSATKQTGTSLSPYFVRFGLSVYF